MEKLTLFRDQKVFILIFILSLLLHIILGLTFGVISDFLKKDPPPIRAKIGVSYAKIPSKPTLINTSSSLFNKPVLKKIDTEFKPKLKNIVPKKPILKKPDLKNSIIKNQFLKPTFTDKTPRLKMSKQQLSSSIQNLKPEKSQKQKLFKKLEKSITLRSNPTKKPSQINKLPKFDKNTSLPSPIKSKKSILKPSNIEVPKFSQENVSPKNLNSPEFSNNFELPSQKTPKISTPPIDEIPSISNVQTVEKLNPKLGELFTDEIKVDEPIQDLGIPEEKLSKKTKEIPDTGYLQRKKLAQLAGEEYNLHIRTQIIPKLGSYPSDLFVRIRLKIIPSGEIIDYEVIKKSGLSSFDQAAELAVRNAVLDPLPQALAENPPYIVLIRIVPQN